LEFNVPFQHKYGYIRDAQIVVFHQVAPLCIKQLMKVK